MSKENFDKILDAEGNFILSDEGLAYLESKYSEDEIPNCPTCGMKLELASIRSGQRGRTYACANVKYPGNSSREEYKAYEDHYSNSRYTPLDNGDPHVIVLLNAYKQLLEQSKISQKS